MLGVIVTVFTIWIASGLAVAWLLGAVVHRARGSHSELVGVDGMMAVYVRSDGSEERRPLV